LGQATAVKAYVPVTVWFVSLHTPLIRPKRAMKPTGELGSPTPSVVQVDVLRQLTPYSASVFETVCAVPAQDPFVTVRGANTPSKPDGVVLYPTLRQFVLVGHETP